MSVWLNTRPKIRPNGIAPIKNETTAQMAVSRIGLCILLFLLPKEESDGCAGEVEGRAHAVLYIALVGVVDQVAVVDEKRERRRVDARLGHIVHAQAALAVHHGMAELAQVGEERVEARGGDLLRARLLGGVSKAFGILPFYGSCLYDCCRLLWNGIGR